VKRRDLLLPAVLLAGVSPAAAQQPPAHARVGWLAHGDEMPRYFFDEALARLGWVEGKNLTIERRFAGSAGEQVSSAAAELVAWRPDVIVAMGGLDARPVLALSRAIPIVIVTAYDPVGQGFAASLARPGGSVTRTATFATELVPKLLELVHDLMPEAGRVSVLRDREIPVMSNRRLRSARRSA
jgi:putative tryptophan/tyrosine transport system substrate-binding protein